MKVILVNDVKNLGKKGEILNVKEGYFNNFLWPNKLAVLASETNLKNLEATIKNAQLREQKEKAKIEEIAKSIKEYNFIIKAKAGPSGKLFGSITSADIAKLIKNTTKYDIDKRKIEIKDHNIKSLGVHDVKLNLHPEVNIVIQVNVVNE